VIFGTRKRTHTSDRSLALDAKAQVAPDAMNLLIDVMGFTAKESDSPEARRIGRTAHQAKSCYPVATRILLPSAVTSSTTSMPDGSVKAVFGG
jgi:hypothetical protein